MMEYQYDVIRYPAIGFVNHINRLITIYSNNTFTVYIIQTQTIIDDDFIEHYLISHI
ncbi:Uncharacterised protein [Citrobacter freundii]|nr:Uncharacterised protein [Citrobacter freundii]